MSCVLLVGLDARNTQLLIPALPVIPSVALDVAGINPVRFELNGKTPLGSKSSPLLLLHFGLFVMLRKQKANFFLFVCFI